MEKNNIIAISGGSASGKSTVAREFVNIVGNDKSLVIELDSYYKDLSELPEQERKKVNFDHPDSLDIELLKNHLYELRTGNSIEKPQYDYSSHSRKNTKEIIYPKQYIIIEGLFALVIKDLFEFIDYKIFVDTADDIRIIRRINRDVKERGRSIENVIEQYLETVRPMHLSIIYPSKKYADFIIEWNEYNLISIQDTVDQITQRIKK